MNPRIMQMTGFDKEVNLKKEGKCPFCKTKVKEDDFNDALSKKEFKISGLCKKCQDKVFSGED